MNKYFTSFALFILLALTCRAADTNTTNTDTWKEYSYKDDLIAFSMPGEPKIVTQTLDTGTVKFPIRLYQLRTADYALLLTANVYPASELSKSTPAQIMKDARDGALSSMKAKEISEKQITIDNNPGIEFDYASDKIHGTIRVYMVGSYVYQLAYVTEAANPVSPDGARFFASFHLLKP